MSSMEKLYLWLTNPVFDRDTKLELAGLDIVKDRKEIEDRFYKELEFGTGGLRGIMGAGTNRINRYTVGKATTGLGDYLREKFSRKDCESRGVAIAYDTRHHSRELAEVAASVLTGQGIRVKLFSEPRPTPQLSFSIPYLNCIAGVVITASHNPKEYNGYKVYDQYGCQLVPDQAKEMISYVNAVDDLTKISFDRDRSLLERVDTTDAFVKAIREQSINLDEKSKREIYIVYTSLHGTGLIPVVQTLQESGFSNIALVDGQIDSNGDFPTVKTPNPEHEAALDMGIQLARKIGGDIVLGTDPDADRVGVGVKVSRGYELLTGNQIGALLMDYILSYKDLSDIQRPAVVKTIVSSELGAEIARRKGVEVFSTLTGFKYIGEKIRQFQEKGIAFIFGYEESYGYLAGTYARDKDAVVSCLLISEMTAEYKAQGKTLLDRLNEIYQEYGYYKDSQDSFTLEGKDGADKIRKIMEAFRKQESPFQGTAKVIDYLAPVEAEPGFGILPASNVLKFVLKGGSWIAVRPSGTEPKIKIYYSIKGVDAQEAEEKLAEIRMTVKNTLGLG